jgi:hypothetical protein
MGIFDDTVPGSPFQPFDCSKASEALNKLADLLHYVETDEEMQSAAQHLTEAATIITNRLMKELGKLTA